MVTPWQRSGGTCFPRSCPLFFPAHPLFYISTSPGRFFFAQVQGHELVSGEILKTRRHCAFSSPRSSPCPPPHCSPGFCAGAEVFLLGFDFACWPPLSSAANDFEIPLLSHPSRSLVLSYGWLPWLLPEALAWLLNCWASSRPAQSASFLCGTAFFFMSRPPLLGRSL